MSAVYNGNPAAITARLAVSITIPVDGDPLTAASETVSTKKLADYVEYLQENAVLLGGFNNVYLSGTQTLLLTGAPGQPALVANGSGGASSGVIGTSGTTGYGGFFTASAAGWSAVRGDNPAGYGGSFTGGQKAVTGTLAGTGSVAIEGDASSAAGATGGKFTAGSAGIGVWGIGGAGNYGGDFYGGAGAPGLRAWRTDGATSSPAIVANGTIDLDSSSAPAGSLALKNKLTRMLFPKCTGTVLMNNSASPVSNSVQNAVITGTAVTITVTFAQAMATATYDIVFGIENLTTDALWPTITSKTTAGFVVGFYKWTVSGAALTNVAATGGELNGKNFSFAVFGDQ